MRNYLLEADKQAQIYEQAPDWWVKENAEISQKRLEKEIQGQTTPDTTTASKNEKIP